MSYKISYGKILNALLGYKGLKSFATLYKGGSINAWGRPDASMHTLKHCLTPDGKIRFIETHITYFKVLPNTEKANAYLEENGPQPIENVIAFLVNTKG